MKRILKGLGIGFVIVVFLYFGLKGFIVTTWTSPTEATAYEIRGVDGRNLTIVFLPKRRTIFHYSSESDSSTETALTEMKGTYGTHYLWRLWSIDGPGKGRGLFSFRLYPDGASPVVMETTVLRKYVHGSTEAVLPREGDRTHPTILFFENAIRFEEMMLVKVPTNEQFVADLLATVGGG